MQGNAIMNMLKRVIIATTTIAAMAPCAAGVQESYVRPYGMKIASGAEYDFFEQSHSPFIELSIARIVPMLNQDIEVGVFYKTLLSDKPEHSLLLQAPFNLTHSITASPFTGMILSAQDGRQVMRYTGGIGVGYEFQVRNFTAGAHFEAAYSEGGRQNLSLGFSIGVSF